MAPAVIRRKICPEQRAAGQRAAVISHADAENNDVQLQAVQGDGDGQKRRCGWHLRRCRHQRHQGRNQATGAGPPDEGHQKRQDRYGDLRSARPAGRNTRIILDLVEKMTDEGVEIVSCKESLDTSTPTGKFVLTMFAALAQLDRDNIVRRTTDGRDARGKHDGEKGGNMPLGYVRVDQGVVVEPRQAALVRRIVLLRSTPSSMGDIAAVLNSEGVPT